jgi:putative ABC transport system ATP-binding protein
MIAGLEKPTKGNIEMFGYNIVKLNERQLARFRQHYVGFIFQSYNLLTALTALENVALPLIFRGVERNKRERMAMKMLEAVGLKKHALHKPTQLSGGQQQRVGIARAFVIRPKVIFADEPTGNLDSRTTKEVMELMMEITRENGQNLVLVTHDSNIAGYADRIVHIMDGKIQQSQLIKRG